MGRQGGAGKSSPSPSRAAAPRHPAALELALLPAAAPPPRHPRRQGRASRLGRSSRSRAGCAVSTTRPPLLAAAAPAAGACCLPTADEGRLPSHPGHLLPPWRPPRARGGDPWGRRPHPPTSPGPTPDPAPVCAPPIACAPRGHALKLPAPAQPASSELRRPSTTCPRPARARRPRRRRRTTPGAGQDPPRTPPPGPACERQCPLQPRPALLRTARPRPPRPRPSSSSSSSPMIDPANAAPPTWPAHPGNPRGSPSPRHVPARPALAAILNAVRCLDDDAVRFRRALGLGHRARENAARESP